MLTTRDNVCLSVAGLAIGTTTSKAKSVNRVDYTIAGRAYSKAATDDLFTLSGTSLAVNEVCAFYLWLDSSGAASITQSAVKKNSTATSGYVEGAFEWPLSPTKVCIGMLKVSTAVAATFIPGTTALGASNVTTTYVNALGDYGAPITY